METKDYGRIRETELSGGAIYAELEGFGGESDFYRIFETMNEAVAPDASRTSIDSLCVMGTFQKDGINVRMSSEGISDCAAFQFDASALSEGELEKVRGWLAAIDAAMGG